TSRGWQHHSWFAGHSDHVVVAGRPQWSDTRDTGRSKSNDKRCLEVDVPLHPEALAVLLLRRGESIDAQVVHALVDQGEQLTLQHLVLHLGHRDLKHRLLHTLTEVDARLGNPAEPTLSIRGGRAHVVCHQELHTPSR